MTAANWPECLAFTLKYEGGYSNHPKDPGGVTLEGVIQRVYDQYRADQGKPRKALTPGMRNTTEWKIERDEIYRTGYWDKVAGDRQPPGVDLVVWDIGVNSGPARGLSIQARALGSSVKTSVGLAALATSRPDKAAQVKAMCVLRASFYRSLSTFSTFGKGWLNRNAACEARGVTMALRGAKESPEAIKKRLETEAATAKKDTAKDAAKAGGSGAGGAVTTQEPTAWGFDLWTLGKVGLLIALVGLLIYFGRRVVLNNERAKEYLNAARGIIGA